MKECGTCRSYSLKIYSWSYWSGIAGALWSTLLTCSQDSKHDFLWKQPADYWQKIPLPDQILWKCYSSIICMGKLFNMTLLGFFHCEFWIDRLNDWCIVSCFWQHQLSDKNAFMATRAGGLDVAGMSKTFSWQVELNVEHDTRFLSQEKDMRLSFLCHPVVD